MDKVISLNGQELPLRATSRNITVYRSQFKDDIMVILGEIIEIGQTNNYAKLNAYNLARLVWTMAKTYNPAFPDFNTWFDGLEAFPVVDVLNSTIDLALANLTTTTPIKPKNPKRAD